MNASAVIVAVIEDEEPIRRFLRASLSAEGFQVVEATNANEGIRVTQQPPGIILLDLGLPDRDGIEVVREIRGWSSVPIVILSARGDEEAKVAALDAGADDYLTKPFGVGELLARIRVAIRHASQIASPDGVSSIVEVGDLRIDLEGRVVTRQGSEVKLTKIEFDLLAALSRCVGKVMTHRQILREVWGSHAVQEPHYVRVFMANLRKKLEDEPEQAEVADY